MYPFAFIEAHEELFCDFAIVLHNVTIGIWHQWSFETDISDLFA